MVEAAGLAFQERQVVNRLEKRLLSIPAPRVPGKETVLRIVRSMALQQPCPEAFPS